MKVGPVLAIVSSWFIASWAVETCDRETDAIQSVCDFSNSLTLISTPNHKMVQGNNCDQVYDKKEWQQKPIVSFKNAKPDKTYTLLCVDPDPPAYKEGQYWLHWLVSNIKGDDFAKGDLTKAKDITGYNGPAPPSGSGLHRYMFLAFEEENKNVEMDTPKGRSRFELRPWLQKHPKLCGPVAGVQFRTQF